ncbi:MAG: hypothetical protein ACR2JC_00725 [Chloroflexota bacterium]|nr:MAG: hypothetical protein DLM70_02075 [Chloroflexota bacterium]
MNDIYRAAIVGAGPGGLIAFTTLRYAGVPSGEIIVMDDRAVPLRAWAGHTAAIRQGSMRSESEGHFFPTDLPGFAQMDAIHHASLGPLIKSTFNRYTPPLDRVLHHGEALGRHFGMSERIEPSRIARVVREEGPVAHFALCDSAGDVRARAKHVLLALGHADLRWPDVCSDRAARDDLSDLLYHAYQPKPYGQRHVLVIGSGMAAAGEWINVFRAGGSVVSIRRSPHIAEQALSAPRCAFGGPWLDRYHRLEVPERRAELAKLGRGSFPPDPKWKKPIHQARAEGQLHLRVGTVVRLERTPQNRVAALVRDGVTSREDTLVADMVVAATGFLSAWHDYDILDRLVKEYHLDTYASYLALGDDCAVPGISRLDSVLMVSGPASRWAYPAADSFAGMKYAARRFGRYAAPEKRAGPRFRTWLGMVRAGWPYTGAEDGWSGSESCASP